MGACIIKIKGKEQYYTFDTIDEAREFVRKNKLDLEQSLRLTKDNKQEYADIGYTHQQRVVNSIKIMHNVSYDKVRDVREKMKFDGYDTEMFLEYSDSHSLSVLLSNLLNEDGHKLFPKYIVENYLNAETQLEICRLYLSQKYNQDPSEKEVLEFYHKYFQGTITDTTKPIRLLSDHWSKYLSNKLQNELNENVIFSDKELAKIDEKVNKLNEQNFESMLYGEVLHKIFECIINNDSATLPYIHNVIFGENGLYSKFLRDYGEPFEELQNPKKIIENLFDENNPNGISRHLNEYIQLCKSIKKQIINSFVRPDGTKPEITLLAEKQFTADLLQDINGKNKIRGKLDLLVVVDGKVYPFDLKVARKNMDHWDEAKKLKVEYQTASYQKLLESLGLHVETPRIIGVELNNTGTIKNPIIKPFNPRTSTQQILNKLFVKLKRNIHTIDVDRIKTQVQTLFTTGSTKGRRDLSIESIINNLRGDIVKNKDGTYRIPYSLIDTDGINWTRHKETVPSEQLEERINKIAQKIYENRKNRAQSIHDALRTDLKNLFNGSIDINEFKLSSRSVKDKNRLAILFSKYHGSGAQLIHEEIGEQLNMFFIQSESGIEIVSCSEHDIFAPWDITTKNAKLFDSITGGLKTQIAKSIGAVKIIEALLILNELNLSDKILDITCLQLDKCHSYKMTTAQLKEVSNFVISYLQRNDNSIPSNINGASFVDPLIKVLYAFNQFVNKDRGIKGVRDSIKPSQIDELSAPKQEVFKQILESKSLSEIKSFLNDFTKNDKIAILEELRQTLINEFPEYFENSTQPVVNMQTTLLYMIETALGNYHNREFITEQDMSLLGINTGGYFASMDLLPVENVQMVRRVIEADFQKIRTRFQSFRTQFKKKVDNLKEGNGYSGARQLLIGDVTKNYLHLFRRKDGKLLNDDLIFRNPWTDTMQEHEREFIKYVLYTIHKYNPSKKHYKWNSYKDLEQSQFEDVDYLCPLLRAKGLDRFRDPDGGWNMPLFSSYWYKETWRKMVNDTTDMKDTLEGQVEHRVKISDTMESMYNEFASHQDPNVRAELIENAGSIQAFSMDVETILQTFVLANESKEIFDENTLPTVRGVLFSSLFQANLTGIEMENFNKFMKDFTKSAVYGNSIIEGEEAKAYKFLAPIRNIGYNLALSYNIANLPREFLMGMFTNISRAFTGAYGKETFSVKDYLKAWGILMGDVPNFIHNVTKIELLNELYGISNMSINEIPAQATSNKTGIFALTNRFSSWSLTAPDYFNRMSMFLAQMIHDGTWEAYELIDDEDGVKTLKYDMSKDKRFNVFTNKEYRRDISNVPSHLKSTFLYQEALYDVMKDDFISEGLDVQTDLPQAYTNKQRNSLKSLSDMSFGYYDRETKAYFFKTSIGVLFKQFMAYLSAKKMQYFQVRSDNTARGDYTQLTDVSGNKIWTIVIGDETRRITDKELNSQYVQYKTTAKPVLTWTGTYMEGVFQSYINLIKDLGIGTMEALRGSGFDTYKKIYNEYLKKGDIRHSNLYQGLWDLFVSYLFMALLRSWLFDDPEVTGVSYEKQMKEKSATFQNLYWICNNACKDFNIFSSMHTLFFNWEIPSFNIIQSTVSNFFRAAGDDDLNVAEAALTGTVNSVGMFKWARPYVNEMLEDE